MLKDVIAVYLDNYIKMSLTETGCYPQISVDEDEVSELCFGEIDEEGYMQWKYEINRNNIDFTLIENQYNVKIPKEVKEYYSSFCFLDLQGFYQNDLLIFDPIDENYDVINALKYDLESTEKKYISIGKQWSTGCSLAVEVDTGYIVLYDCENDSTSILADSLEKIFTELLPKKNCSID